MHSHNRHSGGRNSGAHSLHAHHASGRAGQGSRALLAGLLLTFVFALVELSGGWFFGSLALMSDSGHMFSDSAALLMAVIAARVAVKPPGARHSYGFARAEVIAASLNGLLLLGIVVMIVFEAIDRLQQPQPVSGFGVLVVAFLGLLVNIAVLHILGDSEHNLNTRAARLHVIGDLFGSIAAITAGAVILLSGWYPIDPLLSFVIGGLILVSTIRMLRDALHVLMEGVPLGIDLPEVGQALAEVPGVSSVHDLHVWTIASGQIALSAHVDVDTLDNWPATLERIRKVALSRFGIDHVTIQPELAGGINPEREVVIPIVPRDS
ncbi:MAG: cation transporter, partial [Betaproteobacteria bacterium]